MDMKSIDLGPFLLFNHRIPVGASLIVSSIIVLHCSFSSLSTKIVTGIQVTLFLNLLHVYFLIRLLGYWYKPYNMLIVSALTVVASLASLLLQATSAAPAYSTTGGLAKFKTEVLHRAAPSSLIVKSVQGAYSWHGFQGSRKIFAL